MSNGYHNDKLAILKRLKRAEGQVRGITKMVEQDTYCIDVLTQVNAARAALDKAALELLRDHARHCMTHSKTDQQKTDKAEELVTAISRMLSR